MPRVTTTISTSDPRLAAAALEITLTREERYRRRVAWTTDSGEPFLLDLAEATYLADGDGLVLDDGRVIVVRAAVEALLQITARDAPTLARIAWHIGNRHTPAQITPEAIYIQPDHVLAEMARGLGGEVGNVMQTFEPEGGAYGGHGSLQNGHHHHVGHTHEHPHVNSHEHH